MSSQKMYIIYEQSFVFVLYVIFRSDFQFPSNKRLKTICARAKLYTYMVYHNIYGPPTGPFSRVRPNRTMRVFKLIEYFT